MKKTKNIEKCCASYCSNCCWFKFETTSGDGCCVKDWPDGLVHCSDICKNGKFTSKKEMRHHMAVLLQYMRCNSDKSELTLYRAPKKADVDKAIEFASDYFRTFNKF